MYAVLHYAVALLIKTVAVVAAILPIEAARNPSAERGVAIIGFLIIAASGAFGALGLYLGAARSLQFWRQQRRDRLGAWRADASGDLANDR